MSEGPSGIAGVLHALDRAVANEVANPGRGWERTFFLLSKDERNAFDTFLVAMLHPLSFEAGRVEHRFQTVVKELANAQIRIKALEKS